MFSFPEIFIIPLNTTMKDGIARSMIERMFFVLFVIFEKFNCKFLKLTLLLIVVSKKKVLSFRKPGADRKRETWG